MDLQTSASLTLALKQVLRTTGLSKESWINDRIPLRPGSPRGPQNTQRSQSMRSPGTVVVEDWELSNLENE